MKEQGLGNREQGTGSIGELQRRVSACQARGCDGLVMDGRYCNRCREELEALDAMAARREDEEHYRELCRLWRSEERRIRRENVVEQFRRAGRFAVKWMWVPQLAFVAGVVIYLAWVWSVALLQWLGWL